MSPSMGQALQAIFNLLILKGGPPLKGLALNLL